MGFSRQEHWSGLPFPSPKGTIERKWSHSVVSDSWDPMDCSLPGSFIHGIFQTRVLVWVAMSFSRIVVGLVYFVAMVSLCTPGTLKSYLISLCFKVELVLPQGFSQYLLFSQLQVFPLNLYIWQGLSLPFFPKTAVPWWLLLWWRGQEDKGILHCFGST